MRLGATVLCSASFVTLCAYTALEEQPVAGRLRESPADLAARIAAGVEGLATFDAELGSTSFVAATTLHFVRLAYTWLTLRIQTLFRVCGDVSLEEDKVAIYDELILPLQTGQVRRSFPFFSCAPVPWHAPWVPCAIGVI